jgi:hypothetical protein
MLQSCGIEYYQARAVLNAVDCVVAAITVGFGVSRIRALRIAEHRALLQGACVAGISRTTRRLVWVWSVLMLVIPVATFVVGEIVVSL